MTTTHELTGADVTRAPAPAQLKRMFRRTALGLAGMLMFLAAAGVLYQIVADALMPLTYPPPGQLHDVGGYRLHIDCRGQGSPTVVLAHVADTNSAQWGLVQPAIAGATRVCVYDRAGFGWSDPAAGAQDGAQAARDLHRLLTNAGEAGPFVLAGHSYGANVARIFAATYPDEVAGLVLIDPGIAHDRPGVPAEVNATWKESHWYITAAPWLARTGLLRLADALGALPGHGDLPADSAAAFTGLQLTTRFRDALAAQGTWMKATSAQILEAETHLPDVPLVVLSAAEPARGRSRQVWNEVNATIAKRVPKGVHRLVPGADHMSFALDRDNAQVTAASILEVVAAVQTGRGAR